MVESHTTSITPASHADKHSVGGTDPLVNPLLLHASRHATGGADPVTGLLKDDAEAEGASVSLGTTWADVDISSVVGTNKALCFLLLESKTNQAAGVISWRLDATAPTQLIGTITYQHTGFVVVYTNASGVFQAHSSYNSRTFDFDVIAHAVI